MLSRAEPAIDSAQSAVGQPALACSGVGVQYGAVAALNDVSLDFAPGKIHAVVGQNGAGKTTFARVCAGIVRPTTGTVVANVLDITRGGVQHARAAGVELVHQSFALPLSFTIAEAMEFGAATRSFPPLYSRRGLEARWKDHLHRMGITAPPSARIGDLPIETQQGVEIARALAGDARILILDEPTAVLSPTGIKMLFERIRRLRDEGVTILLILHKIHEVTEIAETVTILRGGKHIAGPDPLSGLNASAIAAAIIGDPPAAAREQVARDGLALAGIAVPTGEPVVDVDTSEVDTSEKAAPVLEVDQLSTARHGEDQGLDGLSLRVEKGSIVGIAGVEGNGQRTLVGALGALIDAQAGRIGIATDDFTRRPLLDRRAAGLRIIPFERNIDGLSLNTSLWENWSVGQLLSGPLLRLIDTSALRTSCRSALERWSVRFSQVDQPASSLSGGNAQKVILAREIDESARVIVAAQPTRGLDIAASAFVWQTLRDARERGAGVVLISSDLDELFDISDRIVVMLSGKIVGEFQPPYCLKSIGMAMTGAAA